MTGHHSVVEGGNAFITRNRAGEPAAIVGINSPLLTLLKLMETRFFEDSEEELNRRLERWKETHENPSPRGFQMATNWRKYTFWKGNPEVQRLDFLATCRNQYQLSREDRAALLPIPFLDRELLELSILLQKKGFCRNQFLRTLSLEADPRDRTNSLREEAFAFDVQLEWCKELIADDLGISVERVAWMLQEDDYHVDLFLFTDHRGNVFLHRSPGKEASLRQNELELRSKGFHPIPLMGRFLNGKSPLANFMNGLIIPRRGEKPLYLTNETSPELRHLQTQFAESVGPYVEVHFIAGDLLETLLTEDGGGFHCLTREF